VDDEPPARGDDPAEVFLRLRDAWVARNARPITVEEALDLGDDDLEDRVWGRLLALGAADDVARFSRGQRMAFATREVESYVDGQGGLYEYFASGSHDAAAARIAVEGYRLIGLQGEADVLAAAADLFAAAGVDGLEEIDDDLVRLEAPLVERPVRAARLAFIRANPAEFAI
jgi:hypothetical protein